MEKNYVYAIFISLCIVFYFSIFVLDFNLNDFFNNDKFKNLLHKFNIRENYITVQYPPLKPIKDASDDLLFHNPELLNMQVMNNNKETRLMAFNEDIEEENSADFQNQQTNIAEFIKQNKSLLFDNNRHNINSGIVDEWNLKGAQMFNKILNNKTTSIEPYSIDNYALI